MDLNIRELKQASSVFKTKRLTWIYGSIFSTSLPKESFDMILRAACLPYFKDQKKLLDTLITLLKANGEIPIIDTPFC